MEQLELLLLTHDPHIAVITETWLHDGISDDSVISDSYKMFRRDRLSRGGGVAVILKNGIDAVLLNQIDDHESLCLKVNCWGNTVILYAVYRPPNSPLDFLCKLYNHMSAYRNSKFLVVGDFNLPNIDWSHLFSKQCQNAELVFDIIFAYDLVQVVNNVTDRKSVV